MMGAPVGRQGRLFYEFCLEDIGPPDHLLRKIDAVLDLSWLRKDLNPYYSDIGRPSICPELLIRMLLLGYRYRTIGALPSGKARFMDASGPDLQAPGAVAVQSNLILAAT